MLFFFETGNRLHSQCFYPCVASIGLSMEAPPQANYFRHYTKHGIINEQW
jgi:hypothetical protein